MSQETSSQDKAVENKPEIIAPAHVIVNRSRTLRKRTSLKPRKSLLKVKSFRPTRAVLGKTIEEE
ncbi:MAG: hypothetical protein BM556_05130 [Bacteriovorax sp. MedPE-SWde]|nr:MAG: hypothetical protein BM556_05130 [Bacteriovorax sp. MedPE-SWde]